MINYQTYLIVLARVFGIFAFNPIFARKNMPPTVKIGASVALSLVIAMPLIDKVNINYDSVPLLAIAIFKEAFVGIILGYLTQMFISTLLVGGEIMDMQSGLGMAKIFDAENGVQMPLFGTIMTYMFILYFFITNCHLSYIKIFAISYDVIPAGFTHINTDLFIMIVKYFGSVLALAVKLALPIIVAEILMDFCVGILMKAVPSIQVIQVNIQLKLLVGLLLLFAIATPMANAIDKFIKLLIDNLVGVLPHIV